MSQKTVTTVERITPEIAEAWLKTMIANRPLNEPRILAWARDMEAGRWRLTGQTIKFDTNSRLIDGQHRLQALTLARVPVWMEVTRHIEPDAISALDSGISRTMSDVLHFRGREYARPLAGALMIVWKILSGRPFKHFISASRQELDELDATCSAELTDIIRDIFQGSSNGKLRNRRNFVPTSLLAGFVYCLRQAHPIKANQFLNGVMNWRELPDGSPFVALQERFMASLVGKTPNTRLTHSGQLAVLIRAWNLFNSGKTAGKLMTHKTVAGVTTWPEIESFNREKVADIVAPEVFRQYKSDGIGEHLEKAASKVGSADRKRRADAGIKRGPMRPRAVRAARG